MKVIALMIDSLREIYAKKVMLGIVIIEVIVLVITWRVLYSEEVQSDYADIAQMDAKSGSGDARQPADQSGPEMNADDSLLLEFDSSARPDMVPSDVETSGSLTFDSQAPASPTPITEADRNQILEEKVRGQLGAFTFPITLAAIFLGIFATASIVPSMMEKGNIDLLLSKAIPRWALLLGRASGGIVAFAVNLTLFTLAIWALYGLASGVWLLPFVFWTVGIALFTYLVLFSGIVALSVFTESWILPVSITYLHMTFLSNYLSNREILLFPSIESPLIRSFIDGLYYVLPQTNELFVAAPMTSFTSGISSWDPFIQGAIFTAAMVGLACWRFERKDF